MATEHVLPAYDVLRRDLEKVEVSIPIMKAAGMVIAKMRTAEQRSGIVLGILQEAMSNMEDDAAKDLIFRVEKMCALYLAEGRLSKYHKKP